MNNVTDPIADMLTRIRNAQMVRHEEVVIPASKLKAAVARILKREGYISDFALEGSGTKKVIKVQLKYAANEPVITGLKRVSRPGRRSYIGAQGRPRVRGGIGVTILSTSRGLMTLSEARKQNVGGEVMCHVW